MSRSSWWAGVAVAAVIPPAVALAASAWGGALAPPADLGFADPGALTRYGLPVFRALRDVGAAVTIGALVLASWALPAGKTPGRMTGSRAKMLELATLAGSVWVWAGIAALVLTYADVVGIDPLAPDGMQYLTSFVTDVELGQALALSTLLATMVTVASLIARRTTSVGLVTIIAIGALWPLASTGHAAGALNHDIAVNAQMAHLVGMSLWFGGLGAVLLVQRHLTGADLPLTVGRYSSIAGWGFGLVAISGVLAAAVRLTGWADLRTDYGALLIAKVCALLVLAAAGWRQRRRVLPQLAADPGRSAAFGRLAATEIAIMAIAVGLGIALGRTPPPPTKQATTPAESLLGFPLPPELGWQQWFTQWRFDTAWTSLAVVAAVLYLLGVRRLRARGDRWPHRRTVAWLIGAAMLAWSTSGAPGVYGSVLFSMHMVQHMTVAMAVPVFLVLGAPVTLALRALPARGDGSRGAREWLLVFVHARWLSVVGHPVIAAAIFVISLVVFYSSFLFELSLRSHTAHMVMVAHFLISGYLLASSLMGIDPGPRRLDYPFRVITLIVTFGFHALFAVSLMAKTTVMAEDWFAALGRTWGKSLQDDQYVGATLSWLLGDYPIAIIGGALIWSWVAADHREARRLDRKADRDDDEDLRRYNEYLHQLHRSS